MSTPSGPKKRHRSASSIDELVSSRKPSPSGSRRPERADDGKKKPKVETVGAKQVSQWLTNLEANNREPGEFYLERRRVKEFHEEHPSYVEAAVSWPKHAETHWDQLGDSICGLFNRDPRRGDYVFVQWALAYLRQTYPQNFDPDSGPPRSIIALTDALCDGSFNPFCMAATLGLPRLCDKLASDVADSPPASRFGSPLYCALMGKAVFRSLRQPETWTDYLQDEEFLGAQNQIPILCGYLESLPAPFTNAVDSQTWAPRWRNGRPVSLLGLAFIIALKEKDMAPVYALVHHRLDVDDSIPRLFHPDTRLLWPESTPEIRADLCTYFFDLTIRYSLIFSLTNSLSSTRGGILFCLDADGVDFDDNPTALLTEMTDDDLEDATRYSLLEDNDLEVLQRLSLDPRFNPNLSMLEPTEGGLLLHHAVSGDQPHIVDFLLQSGADLDGRDRRGRTPLMVVESIEMLNRLISRHKADTKSTDNSGSTVWHIFAASNDVPYIKTLHLIDPHKWENLRRVNNNGNAPFAEAIGSYQAITQSESRQVMAEVLLNFELDDDCLTSGEPLAHYAVMTGNTSLMRRLHAKGVDFTTSDNRGCSALHKIRLTRANAESIILVQRLSDGSRIADFKGHTPPEMVFTSHVNTCGEEEGIEFPTRLFELLLTNNVVESINSAGQCLWERFWGAVTHKHILRMLRSGTFGETVSRFALAALRSLVSVGALQRYEERTGKSGLYAMQVTNDKGWTDDEGDWPVQYYESSFQAVFRHGDAKLLNEFYSSLPGRGLFTNALQRNKLWLGHRFCESGMTAFYPDNAYENRCYMDEIIIAGLAMAAKDSLIVDMFLHFMKPGLWDRRTYSECAFLECVRDERDPLTKKWLVAMYERAGVPVEDMKDLDW